MEMHFGRLQTSLCDCLAKTVKDLDMHTFRCNHCNETFLNFQDINTHFKVKLMGKVLLKIIGMGDYINDTFASQDEQIRAHKMILSAWSSILRNILVKRIC